MTKRNGFTLAEVLITLGIIGVVAAMTIPTLMSNTNGAQFKTAFKKSLSTLNQAAIMNVALDDTDFSSLVAPSSDNTGSKKLMSYILTNRLQSATAFTYSDDADVAFSSDEDSPLNGAKWKESESDFTSYTFADGTTFSYKTDAASCTTAESANCYGFIDVNGDAGPNKEIECTNNSGKVTAPEGEKCEVEASGIYDIFPVRFYGQTVVPATDAARAVLYNK